MKQKIINLTKELWATQEEMSSILWTSRITLFQESSNISLTIVKRIAKSLWCSLDDVFNEDIIFPLIRKEFYSYKYKKAIQEAEYFHNLLSKK